MSKFLELYYVPGRQDEFQAPGYNLVLGELRTVYTCVRRSNYKVVIYAMYFFVKSRRKPRGTWTQFFSPKTL